MSLLLLILGVALASMLFGVCLVLWWAVPKLERGFIFRPARDIYKTPADLGIPFEQCFIETPDGCRLSAWHLCPSEPAGALIYFHGNLGNLSLLNEIFALFYGRGLQVFAVDYRGYGWSTGTPSEEGLYQDALAAVEYFRKNLRRCDLPLVYCGRSLGSCVASYAAGKIPPDGLILESAFRNKSALVKYYPQFRPFYPFSKCRLDTLRHLKAYDFPVLLVHGDGDRTIPLEEGRHLFERLTGPKQFYCVQGGDHINLHRVDADAYMERVLRFVEAVRPPTIH